MNTLPYRSRARLRQAGMTLVELLVAITIGLFIIGAALMVFQSTSGIGRQISELTQIRQEGAHAFRVIGKQVREAGSVEPEYIVDNNNFRFSAYTWVNGTSIANWSPPNGADFLSISQQQQSSTVYTDLIRNCLGETVTSSNRRSDFYLNNGNLMCVTGSNTGGQPVISNVNAFKVRYRVRVSDTTKQFVDTPTDWALVDAVEVCLDLVGTKATPTNGANYTDCEGTSVSRSDRLHVVQRNLFTVFSAQR
ncbi:MAG: prepilin-type N-terminal cleavage/methylation domain-containing protein [Ottowia sp.]|uniref:PilW family protein n=1 Tax=Ottowia sp. TaxID=1898956 RepID=UPI0039E5B579